MHLASKVVAAFFTFASLRSASAQVSTKCQPLTTTCLPDEGLTTGSYFVDFTKTKSQPTDWTLADYEYVNYGPNGAEFTFAKKGDAPTMHSNWKFFFGRAEFVAKAAPGKGIISSMVLLSDDLDEIDWEIGGTWQNTLETNYFGKAVVNYGVAKWVPCTSPQTQFHTYTLDWSPTSLVWSIDGRVVRTLTPADAGNEYPQTPMMVSLSLWDGGDPDGAKGTQDWAGGITPIPPPENYTMFIKSVKIENTNPAKQYQYSDHSGNWKSIKVINDTKSSSTSSSPSSTSSTSIQSNSVSSSSTLSASTQSKFSSTSTGLTSASQSSSSASYSGVMTFSSMVPSNNHVSTLSSSPSSSNTLASGSSSSGSNVIVSSSYSNSLNSASGSAGSTVPSSSAVPSFSGGVSGLLSFTNLPSSSGVSSIISSQPTVAAGKSTGLTSSITTLRLSSIMTSSVASTSESKSATSSIMSTASTAINLLPSPGAPKQNTSNVGSSSLTTNMTSPLLPSGATVLTTTISSQAVTTTLIPTTFSQSSTLKSTLTTSTLDVSRRPIEIVIGPSGVGLIAFNHTFQASLNISAVGNNDDKISKLQACSWLSSLWNSLTSKLHLSGFGGTVNSRTEPMHTSSNDTTAKKVAPSTSAGTGIANTTSSAARSDKAALATLPRLGSASFNINMNGTIPRKIQEIVTTEIILTTVTSCPITSTVTPPNGKPTQSVTTILSTVKITSTSTVCTQCLGPIASSLLAGGNILPSPVAFMQSAMSVSPSITTLGKSSSPDGIIVSPVPPAVAPFNSSGSSAENIHFKAPDSSAAGLMSATPVPGVSSQPSAGSSGSPSQNTAKPQDLSKAAGEIHAEAAVQSSAPPPSPTVTDIATPDANGKPTTIQVIVTPTLTRTAPATNSAGNAAANAQSSSNKVTSTSQNVVATKSSTHTNFMVNPTAVGGGLLGIATIATTGTAGGTGVPSSPPLVSPITPFEGEAVKYGMGGVLGLVIIALVFVCL